MFDRFTDRAKKVMNLARQAAQSFNHEYFGEEHLLLGIIADGGGVAANVLMIIGVDLNEIRVEVEKLLKTGRTMSVCGQLPFTPRARKALEYALDEACNLGHDYIGTEHLLLGLVREYEGIAGQVLASLGVNYEDTKAEILKFIGADTAGAEEEKEVEPSLSSVFELLQEVNRKLDLVLSRLDSLSGPWV